MVPAWAKDYIGLPFSINGRTREGVDCWGLVLLVYSEVFDLHPNDPGTPNTTCPSKTAPIFNAYKKVEWEGCEKPEPGNVILFRVLNHPSHVGIVLDGQLMLHITSESRSCITSYAGPQWSNRVIGYYKYKGLPK